MRPWRLLHGAEYPAGHRVHGQAVHALSHGVLHTPALEGGQLGQAHWLEDEGWKIKKIILFTPVNVFSLQKGDKSDVTPQYVKDFKLLEWNNQSLFYEYLERVIQVISFP